MKYHEQALDFLAAKIVSAASYFAAAGNVVIGLTLNDLSIVVGILLGIATFIVNWYYKHASQKLAEKRYQKQNQPVGNK